MHHSKPPKVNRSRKRPLARPTRTRHLDALSITIQPIFCPSFLYAKKIPLLHAHHTQRHDTSRCSYQKVCVTIASDSSGQRSSLSSFLPFIHIPSSCTVHRYTKNKTGVCFLACQLAVFSLQYPWFAATPPSPSMVTTGMRSKTPTSTSVQPDGALRARME